MQTLRERLGFRPVLHPDEKEDFFKWVTVPNPVEEKEMEAFIEKIKEEEEKTFIVTWKPEDQDWLTEEEMSRKTRRETKEELFGVAPEGGYKVPQFVCGVKTETLRRSLRELQKECLEETKEDIREISRKRNLLFKQVADLHVKESLLVARQRAVELESAILDETV